MATQVTIDLRHVARGLDISLRQVQAVVELLDEGNTVPFITRYRKDRTDGLDEEQIRQVQDRLAKMRQLADRKQTILRSIESQGKLTEELAKQILSAGTTRRLEDLYLPYKPRKQTLATLARTRGLEPLAREILQADPACADLDARAADFANPDRQVPTPADALLGAGHILAEQFSERADLRQQLRDILQRTGKLVSVQIASAETTASAGTLPKQTGRPSEAARAGDKGPKEADADSAVQSSQATQPTETASEQTAPEFQPTDTSRSVAEPPADAVGLPEGGASEEATAAPQSAEQTAPSEELTPACPTRTPESETEATEATGNEAVEAEPTPTVAEPAESETAASETAASETAASETAASETTTELAPASEQTAASVTETGSSHAEGPTDQAPAEQSSGAPAEPPSNASSEVASVATNAQSAKPASTTRTKKGPAKRQAAKLSKKELKKKKAEEKRTKAFRDYFDYLEAIKKIPPHRVLAINRGERAKILRVKIESDLEAMGKVLDELLVPPEHPHAEYLRGCARDALARLIVPSLEREARRELTDRAETHAVSVFARNLRNLLLQPPVRDRRVLAVDPAYRSGCKLAALDQFGNVLEHAVVYLIGRAERRQQACEKVIELVRRFRLSVVVIGNGTACRETEDFFSELVAGELKDDGVAYVIVNEAGASVYSTSRLGREEFPNYDATLRGAISIGRRLQDPLSELVKIDAANIGVGLYQHDVKAKHLRTSLDEVVESCVNYVGVDVNTASAALLRYVSGLNQLTARRLYEHRREHGPFRNREQLRAVPGFGEATFVQATGFLKISAGDNPLDATWIHPESYEVAGKVLTNLGRSATDLSDKTGSAALADELAKVGLDELAQELEVGTLTLKDIMAQLARPGRDPREDLPAPVFKKGVLKLEDLSAGMELTGTVLNVVDFGAFVDIGMHDSGLVHVSQLADKFVRDPHEVVAVGDIVSVWVMEVDAERRRVSLTMIQPGSQRPRRPRRGEQSEPDKASAEEGGRVRSDRPAKSRESRRPRPKGPPRSKMPARGRGTQPPKYRPRPRPKPVVPITDAMKTGKEPMRTFGDLAQFFDESQQNHTQDDGGQKKKQKKKEHQKKEHKREEPEPNDVAAASETEPQVSGQEVRDSQETAGTPQEDAKMPQDQSSDVQDVPSVSPDESPSSPDEVPSSSE